MFIPYSYGVAHLNILLYKSWTNFVPQTFYDVAVIVLCVAWYYHMPRVGAGTMADFERQLDDPSIVKLECLNSLP